MIEQRHLQNSGDALRLSRFGTNMCPTFGNFSLNRRISILPELITIVGPTGHRTMARSRGFEGAPRPRESLRAEVEVNNIPLGQGFKEHRSIRVGTSSFDHPRCCAHVCKRCAERRIIIERGGGGHPQALGRTSMGATSVP